MAGLSRVAPVLLLLAYYRWHFLYVHRPFHHCLTSPKISDSECYRCHVAHQWLDLQPFRILLRALRSSGQTSGQLNDVPARQYVLLSLLDCAP